MFQRESSRGPGTDVIDDPDRAIFWMMPEEPSPTEGSVVLTSTVATHGPDSRTLAIAMALVAVAVIAIGAVMSRSTGAKTASHSQAPSTTAAAAPASAATPDELFVAAVRPWLPGEPETTLIATGRAFCQTVAANNGNRQAATLQSLAANRANTNATIVDSDLVQVQGAAVSAYCPQYNIDALSFS